jgi:nucleotide-binding universal stress UspA family protein
MTEGRTAGEIANRPWPPVSEGHAISVIHLPFTPTPETWALPDSYYFRLENAGRQQAESAIDRAIARLRENNSARETPLTLTNEVIVGHPEMVIIETAKKWGADLIVVGSHGYRGPARALLGSVSQAVATQAKCSVEIARRRRLDEDEEC